MKRRGQPWLRYKQVMEAYSAGKGQPLAVAAAPQKQEIALGHEISKLIHNQNDAVLRLLEECGVRPTYFRHHLSGITKWRETRRTLLASGANFQLLESLAERDDGSDGWEGLTLSGTRAEQEQQVTNFQLRHAQVAPSIIFGLNSPAPIPELDSIRYNSTQKAWVYPSKGTTSETLHPSVARSLILYYVKGAGRMVADPMSGSGVIPKMARSLGHFAWASDKEPVDVPGLEIARFDIYEDEITELEGYDDWPQAHLVVLHPPTPTWFKDNIEKFADPNYLNWLGRVIENSWPLVEHAGHLALIVILGESLSDVAGMVTTLVERTGAEAEGETVKGHHIAVSRDGREGWHILTVQKKDFDYEDKVEKAKARNEQPPPRLRRKLKPPQTPS